MSLLFILHHKHISASLYVHELTCKCPPRPCVTANNVILHTALVPGGH